MGSTPTVRTIAKRSRSRGQASITIRLQLIRGISEAGDPSEARAIEFQSFRELANSMLIRQPILRHRKESAVHACLGNRRARGAGDAAIQAAVDCFAPLAMTATIASVPFRNARIARPNKAVEHG